MTGSDPFKNIRQRLNINREPRRSNNRGCPNCGGLDHEDPKSCFQRPRANGKRPVVVEPPPAENFVEDHAVFKTDGAVESAAGVEAAVEHLSSIEKNGLLAPSKTAKEIVYQKLTERRAIPYYLQKRPDPINVNDGFTSIPQLPRRAAWDGDTSQVPRSDDLSARKKHCPEASRKWKHPDRRAALDTSNVPRSDDLSARKKHCPEASRKWKHPDRRAALDTSNAVLNPSRKVQIRKSGWDRALKLARQNHENEPGEEKMKKKLENKKEKQD